MRLVGPLLEHQTETQFRVLRMFIDHLLRVALGHRNRLFTEHVKPMPERLYGERRMRVVRHGDENRIHAAGGEELLRIVERADIVLLRLVVRLLRIDVADRCQLHLRNLIDPGQMQSAHIAQADNSKSHFIHLTFIASFMKRFHIKYS